MTLSDLSVPVAVGTRKQLQKLEELLAGHETQSLPGSVLVIGGGTVGCAAARALKDKGLTVFVVDCDPELLSGLKDVADRVTIGDAADRETLMQGGLNEASLVILSTNDDAVNIYLSIYCRRLNPDVRIVSRITHEKNLESIYRAGTDFVLSYATLGAEAILAATLGREPLIVGEDVEIFNVPVPPSLAGRTLAESSIGALTGLVVLAVESAHQTNANPYSSTELPPDGRLTVLGTPQQLMSFKKHFR